jgi:hypothetical protein
MGISADSIQLSILSHPKIKLKSVHMGISADYFFEQVTHLGMTIKLEAALKFYFYALHSKTHEKHSEN